MHNKAAVDAILAADVVVIPLAGAEAKVKATLALLSGSGTDARPAEPATESDPGVITDGRPPRVVIALSSIATWARTPMNADGTPLTASDEARRGVVPGAAKATMDAERLVLRAASPTLDTHVVCPGVLYGAGEFPDGFLAPMRAAWEGKPVPIFGAGENRLPICHADNFAATVVSLAAARTTHAAPGNPKIGEEGRYVLAMDAATNDDGSPGFAAPTQLEVGAAIARAFDVGMIRVSPAALATMSAADAAGAANLLLDVRIAATEPFASSVVPFHRGGHGPPVEPEEEDDASDLSGAAAFEPEGGMPAVVKQFLELNNLSPLRVIVRGPPLSFSDELAAAAAEAYALPLLTPSALLSPDWLVKFPEELREKVGDGVGEDEDAAEKFNAFDDEVKTEIIKAAMGDKHVIRVGYIMAGGLPGAGDDLCRALFTHIPPRPPKRKKKRAKKKKDEESGSEASEASEEPEEEEEREEEEEEEEETEEQAEARRCLNPSVAPTTIMTLQINDQGQYARKFKQSHPELYEKYKEWAKAEEAAYEAAEAEAEAAAAAAAEGGDGEKKPRTSKSRTPRTSKSKTPRTSMAKSKLVVITDPVVKHFVTGHGVKRATIDASGSVFSRLRAAKRALATPHNFVGFADDDDDAIDPEEAAAAAAEAAAIKADEDRRRAKKERAATLVSRQKAEVAAREADALHVRSASLRQYLSTEVMPVVTDAMLQMLKLRPEDPIHALSEYLIRKDREAAIEEEVNRVSLNVMDLAIEEEVKAAERAERLEISQTKAREAFLTIGTPRSVKFVPEIPKAVNVTEVDPDAEAEAGETAEVTADGGAATS